MSYYIVSLHRMLFRGRWSSRGSTKHENKKKLLKQTKDTDIPVIIHNGSQYNSPTEKANVPNIINKLCTVD